MHNCAIIHPLHLELETALYKEINRSITRLRSSHSFSEMNTAAQYSPKLFKVLELCPHSECLVDASHLNNLVQISARLQFAC